jgi:hypothetical protein
MDTKSKLIDTYVVLTSTLYPPIPISKLCKNGTF